MVRNGSASYGKFKVQKTISQYGSIIFSLEQLDMWVFFKKFYAGELEVGIVFHILFVEGFIGIEILAPVDQIISFVEQNSIHNSCIPSPKVVEHCCCHRKC
jgi:hypothetical protein